MTALTNEHFYQEISRLQAQIERTLDALASASSRLRSLASANSRLRSEIDRLRAALEKIANDKHSQWHELVDMARYALEAK